ncbi:MAG: bifunctional 4-hydroxy-2-oxoglutarate aldolase/2-dehydro-3-deoxy-phosphogluconate aldolase [Chthoniobacterales bacterium]
MNALEVIGRARLVPVIEIEDADAAQPLGEALMAGGLPIAEVTFRTDAALESLRRMADIVGLVAGAGTILNAEQARAAIDAGARFLVSPGCFPKVLSAAAEAGVPVFPGIATPTDIGLALDHGRTVLKYFPAEALGGTAMLTALAAPFPGVMFIPTGGINVENLSAWLALPQVFACGGSWMAGKALLRARDFDTIRERTAAAVALARKPSQP